MDLVRRLRKLCLDEKPKSPKKYAPPSCLFRQENSKSENVRPGPDNVLRKQENVRPESENVRFEPQTKRTSPDSPAGVSPPPEVLLISSSESVITFPEVHTVSSTESIERDFCTRLSNEVSARPAVFRPFADDELREIHGDVVRTRLQLMADPNELTLKVLTWNIHGDSKGGFGEIRKALVSQTGNLSSFDIGFLQEVKWVANQVCGRHLQELNIPGRRFLFTSTDKEAGILHDRSVVKASFFPNDDLRAVLTEVQQEDPFWKSLLGSDDNVRTRRNALDRVVFRRSHIQISQLAPRPGVLASHPFKVMVVSFHNVKTRKATDRHSAVDAAVLLKFCAELQERMAEPVPCIIGGDFNADLTSIVDMPAVRSLHWAVPQYERSERRQKLMPIDFFCFRNSHEADSTIRLSSVSALELQQTSLPWAQKIKCLFSKPEESAWHTQVPGREVERDAVEKEKSDLTCDHDPIEAVLHFRARPKRSRPETPKSALTDNSSFVSI